VGVSGAAHDKPAPAVQVFFFSTAASDRGTAGPGETVTVATPAPRWEFADVSKTPAGTSPHYVSLPYAAADVARDWEFLLAGKEDGGASPVGIHVSAGSLALLGENAVTGSLPDAVWARVITAEPAQDVGFSAHGPGVGRLAGAADSSDKETLDAGYGALFGVLLANPLALYPGPETEQPTLLLVESDEDTRDAMTVMLFQEGYQVLAVATGRDAWNVLRAPFSPIDAVLMDVHLPDISGVQLCQRLREAYPKMPVFAWVPGSASAEAAQLVKLGVQHWSGQSEALAELVGTVRAFLRGSSTPEA
jgi:CheY-like chemotaxis protein